MSEKLVNVVLYDPDIDDDVIALHLVAEDGAHRKVGLVDFIKEQVKMTVAAETADVASLKKHTAQLLDQINLLEMQLEKKQ